jgi:hypothetical protein
MRMLHAIEAVEIATNDGKGGKSAGEQERCVQPQPAWETLCGDNLALQIRHRERIHHDQPRVPDYVAYPVPVVLSERSATRDCGRRIVVEI